MLKTTKSITLNGTSQINGELAATMYATINSDGGSNQNSTIVNSVLYESNKSEVRSDFAAFNEKFYELQDEIGKEA